MTSKRLAWQLARYGIVGLASNGLAYGFYLLITFLGVAPEATAAGIYLVGASSSYLGNYKWTFASKRSHASALPKFVAVHILGFSVQLLLISYLYRNIGLRHQLAQLVTVGCVSIILFLSFKYYVYPQQNTRSTRGST
ncbi:GtrA family protein [Cyanobium sp. ATX 6A2]|uniref:GtrA family protein n=1 Tax=Cyanobium sp. ATX 6A2 TaxID=2823700 RepID=UPI0020CF6A34|nr:GtrA family protein [Cyanobium sp. ATX 6A2]MCP9888708.1 GtrA family protein [Cyanobium sp. ATX 6A2]